MAHAGTPMGRMRVAFESVADYWRRQFRPDRGDSRFNRGRSRSLYQIDRDFLAWLQNGLRAQGRHGQDDREQSMKPRREEDWAPYRRHFRTSRTIRWMRSSFPPSSRYFL